MTTEIFKTKLGWMGVGATEHGVATLVLPKPSRRAVERELAALNGNVGAGLIPACPKREGLNPSPTTQTIKTVRTAILSYLAGKARYLNLPIDLNGQPRFRRKVWAVLQTIPYGRVRSYGWVARKMGNPGAARAVGAACGANPVPLLVPCHRVIAADGSLGGFSGGLRTKKRLLKLEGTIS